MKETVMKLVSLGLCVLTLALIGMNVRPSTGIAQAVPVEPVTVEPVAVVTVQEETEAVTETVEETVAPTEEPVQIVYKIPEEALVAPVPDPNGYHETTDPMEVQSVIDECEGKFADEGFVWNPDIVLFEGSSIEYYVDDSILVICWKEVIDNGVVSFSEVKMLDGSQIRRTIAGNTYGSSLHYKATEMAAQSNAVVAINGDFYDYRHVGITTYQRQVYRVKPEKVESAYFTAEGDMIFSHMGELATKEEAQQFVDDNDVVFGIAFGPIMVENGELKQTSTYIMGETRDNYSRAAIAQVGKLHYLLMTIGQEGAYRHRTTTNRAAEIIYEKGVWNAYTLDGGQTATIAFNGTTFNRVDWDTERTMSDIIYFASALPSQNG